MLKKAEGRRQKAEGQIQVGTRAPPDLKHPTQVFGWGLKPVAPSGRKRRFGHSGKGGVPFGDKGQE